MTQYGPSCSRQRGASLIEIMVGIVIGLIAILVIYQVFSVSEGLRRNTTGVGDAQQNGLLSSFALGIELANAGNGISTAAQELYGCTNLSSDPTKSVRPVPILITDSLDANTPDEFSVFYSVSTSLAGPVDIRKAAAPNEDLQVQSPLPSTLGNAFQKDDMIVAINTGGLCSRSIVTSVTGPDGDGVVTLAHSVQDGSSVAFTSSSLIVNLGKANRVQRVRYYLEQNPPPTDPLFKNYTLYSQNLFDPAASPVPLASGIVNMKLQYGVDSDDDGFLDDWVAASEAGWDAATLMSGPKTTTPIAQLSRIKAVRIAVVTRSEQYDREVVDDFAHTLFACATPPTPPTPPCDGKIDISAPKNWRYRVYETVVPMRNVIWNRAL